MTRTAEAPAMPNHAKAIEAAARAMLAIRVKQTDETWDRYRQPDSWKLFEQDATAAITAFLRTVEPSEAMIDTGCAAYWPVSEFATGPLTNGQRTERTFKAMSETLANEVEQSDAR